MKLSIFGTGYVGLVSGACLAEVGHDVVCMDVDPVKIANLKAGILPIWEPGLAALVERNAKEGRLRFTTDAAHAVQHAQVQFIAVGTPPDEDGSADMQYVLAVAQSIASHMTGYKVIVNKSTVPVGTADQVTATINAVIASRPPVIASPPTVIASEARQSSGHGSPRPFGPRDDDAGAVIASEARQSIPAPALVIASEARQSIPASIPESPTFDVISNPEFLKEGAAVNDFLKPDRIIIGTESEQAQAIMRELYEPFNRNHDRIIYMDVRSVELTKYAANAMLVTKISFMNEMAIVDGRNLYQPDKLQAEGWNYLSVGRTSASNQALAPVQ